MMKPQVETRTVTAGSSFDDFAEFLESDELAECIEIVALNYEHTVTDPRCDPEVHEYDTSGPHTFRLEKRKTTTVKEPSSIGQSSSVGGEEQVVVVQLSDSVYEMYAGWTMSWKFTIEGFGDDGRVSISETPEGSRIIKQPIITPYSNPVEWKTITVGRVMEMRNLLEGYDHHDDLEFTVTWSRQEPSFTMLDITRHELDNLKRAMAQTQAMFLGILNRPSIEITRLVFRSKRSGSLKYLYVPSNVLLQYEYFQTCHSSEYSETQHVDKTKRKRDEIEKPSEELYCDDSDDEWDSDPEDVEPEKNVTFKATIHITGTSRRTYQAFIDYAVCGALYFAPLRSTYLQYAPSIPGPEDGRSQLTPWPKWAEAHCTPYSMVPGFKTLTSPKSLYRLSDMLIIPHLKAICRHQVRISLHVKNVISELRSSVFEQHEELSVDAYNFMRYAWNSFESSEIVPFLTNMSQTEAALVYNHILKTLPVSNASHQLTKS